MKESYRLRGYLNLKNPTVTETETAQLNSRVESTMKKTTFAIRTLMATGSVLLFFACSEPPPESSASGARLVKSIVVAPPTGEGIRNFPGRIDSAHKAELSFRVNGKLDRLLVTEGEVVKRGQLLAQLDKTDFEIVLRDRQATLDRADKDYIRAKDLVDKGAISRRDYDQVEANFKTASAALEQAQQNLQYTQLLAPFDGNIARRHIERFEEVRLNEPVFSLVDLSQLQVEFNLPESMVLMLPTQPQDASQSPEVWVTFEGTSNERFDLTFKEITTRADENTQTFKVKFSLPAPENILVLPGMTASVTVDLSKVINETSVYYVPVSAVSGNVELDPRVWRVDEQTMTVHEIPVQLGRLVGSSIEVTGGLTEGVRIVTAGAAYLAEGMQVRLMVTKEQAIPRADDV